MSRYLERAINKLLAAEQLEVLSEDAVLAILGLLRQYIEANGLKKQYPHLMLFANWSLHPSLNQGIVQAILEDISGIISKGGDAGDANDRINEILSTQLFRADVLRVLHGVGYKSKFLTSLRGWKVFLSVLLNWLVNKPMERDR